jgi:hypothetical protein
MDNITKMMTDKFNEYSSGKLKGIEGAIAKSEFTRELSEYDEEANEGMGAASAGGYSAPLFGESDDESDGEITKVETKEATSSSSSGSYDAPGFEDVKMRGNHPRGSGRSYKKTQIPGGQFVEVKSKCKKFPYCNQGIGALKLYGGKKLKEAIKNVSEKMNISEDKIREIIAYEYRNLFSK